MDIIVYWILKGDREGGWKGEMGKRNQKSMCGDAAGFGNK